MLRFFFNIIIKLEFLFTISWLYKNIFIKRISDHSNSNSENKNILFIDPTKFRDDIKCLNKISEFNISTLSSTWLWATITPFISEKINILDYINCFSSDKRDLYFKINSFHEVLVRKICANYKIDCVIAVSYRYVEYLPWLKAFRESSVPVVIFYRECLLTTDRLFDAVLERTKHFKNYPVDHVIVHNNATKKAFVGSNMVSDPQITVAGALRMDYLIKMLGRSPSRANKRERKRVTLFYFDYRSSIFGKTKLNESESVFGSKYKYVEKIWPKRSDLFSDLHSVLIKLAQDNPEIDVVVKCKKEQIEKSKDSWKELLELQNKSNLQYNFQSNYKVTTEGDVHQLIMGSDVIIGLQTSAVLESAIANKHIILPLFYNYSKTDNFNDFHWHNHLHLFDIAYDAIQLYEMVLDFINNKKEISPEIIAGRKKLFKKYFSDLDGKALQKYSETIKKVISENNNQIERFTPAQK